MRILVLTQMYPPHHLGGYEVVCQEVVERWTRRGHHVQVLTSTQTMEGVKDGEPPVPVHRDLAMYWREHRILNPNLIQRWRMERSNQRALRSVIDRIRPDVVSVWHMGAMSFGLLQTVDDLEIPMVLVIGDDWLVYGPRVDAWARLFWGRPTLGRLGRRIVGIPTTVSLDPMRITTCFASEWLRARAIELSPLRLGRTVVVPHGIDVRRFDPGEETSWNWRILTLGRVEERKGVHVAIQALAHLPQSATLDVVGPAEASYLRRLQGLASSVAPDRIRFPGVVARDDIAERYRAADVYVHPVIWDEPFGLTLLEAMAAGTPVISTGTGGSAEFLVDEENCLLVPRNDSAALAAALRRLSADDVLRRALVAGGLRTAARLDVEEMASKLEAWHRRTPDGSEALPVNAEGATLASEPDPDV